MLIAEDFEVELSEITLEHAPPDEKRYGNPILGGVQATGGSTTIRAVWQPLRQAGATARTMLVMAAARRWDVDPASCHAGKGNGIHTAGYRSLGYGPLGHDAPAPPGPGKGKPERAEGV